MEYIKRWEFFGRVYLGTLGGVLIVGVFVQIYKSVRFYRQSIQTPGVIISLEGRVFRHKTYYYPRIEYTDNLNNTVSFIGGLGSRNKYDSSIGKKVTIRYVPGIDNNNTARLWALPTVIAGPLGFLFLGGISLGVSLFAK
ncbi:MAG: DUF3592 domain-containing protein [Chthoniobacterales bacterium]